MTENYIVLQHGIFGRSKSDHKYIRKYMGSTGKWIYVYAEDLKDKVNNAANSAGQALKSGVNKTVSLGQKVTQISQNSINSGKQIVKNIMNGYHEGNLGRSDFKVRESNDYQISKAEAQNRMFDNAGLTEMADRGRAIIEKLKEQNRQTHTTSYRVGNAIGLRKDKIDRSIYNTKNNIKDVKNSFISAVKNGVNSYKTDYATAKDKRKHPYRYDRDGNLKDYYRR